MRSGRSDVTPPGPAGGGVGHAQPPAALRLTPPTPPCGQPELNKWEGILVLKFFQADVMQPAPGHQPHTHRFILNHACTAGRGAGWAPHLGLRPLQVWEPSGKSEWTPLARCWPSSARWERIALLVSAP